MLGLWKRSDVLKLVFVVISVHLRCDDRRCLIRIDDLILYYYYYYLVLLASSPPVQKHIRGLVSVNRTESWDI